MNPPACISFVQVWQLLANSTDNKDLLEDYRILITKVVNLLVLLSLLCLYSDRIHRVTTSLSEILTERSPLTTILRLVPVILYCLSHDLGCRKLEGLAKNHFTKYARLTGLYL